MFTLHILLQATAPNSHRSTLHDKTVEFRRFDRCKLGRQQSATVCGNLEQSDRTMPCWLHSIWASLCPAQEAVERLGLSVFKLLRTCSDFRLSVGDSLESSRIQCMCKHHPTRRDPTRQFSRILATRPAGLCIELWDVGGATAATLVVTGGAQCSQ